MSGIPVYTQSPINASLASGATPHTAAPAPAPSSHVSSAPAPATAAATSISSYPSARPGAPAVPAPTGAAQRYAPVQATRTIQSEPEGPPAPQPGAAPIPTSRSTLPPPPKAGESKLFRVFSPGTLGKPSLRCHATFLYFNNIQAGSRDPSPS